jgi:hypothetical protein
MRFPVGGSSAEGRIASRRHNAVIVRAPPKVLAEMNRAIRASRVDGITGAAHD